MELAPAPVNPAERIDAIDVLRGLALFGVLAINIVTVFRVSIFEQFLPATTAASSVNRGVEIFLKTAIELKALALFSFLFGVGLAIQFERLAEDTRCRLLVRRLTVLLLIGAVHLLFIWNGDILTEYAVAGFAVLPWLWGPRWLLAAGALVFLGLYLIMPLLPPVVSLPTAAWMTDHVAEASHVYGMGGFLGVLEFRIRELPAIFPLHVWVFPRTVALFLFGAFVWRSGILRRSREHARLFLTIAVVGILVGAGLTAAVEGAALFGWPSLGRWHYTVERLATVLLASGYAAAVIGLVNTSGGQSLLAWAAPLGRMAFTNYLAQSVIFGWIFYGYGLGLFGRLGVTATLMIGIGVFAAQALISTWWLRHYRFGPVEWIWRTLMYGQPQPFRQS